MKHAISIFFQPQELRHLIIGFYNVFKITLKSSLSVDDKLKEYFEIQTSILGAYNFNLGLVSRPQTLLKIRFQDFY